MEQPSKALLLGARGLLGAAFITQLRQDNVDVAAPSHGELDICDLQALRRYVAEQAPQLLINAAAQSQVDRAETEPDEAFTVNAVGAHNVALAAAEADITAVHVSTDYVFDGNTRCPYREVDPTGRPTGVYGESKALGEQLVRQCCRKHFITRVAGLFGPGRRSFVDWVINNADPQQPLTIVADRFVSPTGTVDAVRQILALAATPYYGTYHCTGHGVASWYQLAHTALRLAGKDPDGAIAIPDTQLKSVAPRPAYSALENHLLKLRGLDTMQPWEEALEQYVRSTYLR